MKFEKKKKNMIFLHDTQYEKNKNSLRKLNYKWKNFYQIIEIIVNKDIYFLIKLNDIDSKNTFVDNRFKKFRFRFFSDVEKIDVIFEIIAKIAFNQIFKIENEVFDTNSFANFKKNLIFFKWSLIVIVFFFHWFRSRFEFFLLFFNFISEFSHNFYFDLIFFFFHFDQLKVQISCAMKHEKLKKWNLFYLKIVNLSIKSIDKIKIQFFISKKCNYFCRIF